MFVYHVLSHFDCVVLFCHILIFWLCFVIFWIFWLFWTTGYTVLQRVAVCCNVDTVDIERTQRYSYTTCPTLLKLITWGDWLFCLNPKSVWPRVAESCRELQCRLSCAFKQQCVAVCCNVLQCDAVWCSEMQRVTVWCSAIQCNAVWCSAVWCSVLQCIAVQCSAMQCNAVQCSVMQCDALCCTVAQILLFSTEHKK